MNLKNTLRAVSAAAVMALVSVPASAAYVVLDGWQLVTPTTTTTQIGRMNLASGSATVEQEVNGSGQAFVGARFSESGAIYSISYTKENVVGAGDIGGPQNLGADDLVHQCAWRGDRIERRRRVRLQIHFW
jgi:hypothetical protein